MNSAQDDEKESTKPEANSATEHGGNTTERDVVDVAEIPAWPKMMVRTEAEEWPGEDDVNEKAAD